MKISKSVLDAIAEAMSHPLDQHSSRGNYVVEAKTGNRGYGYHGTAPEGSSTEQADKRYAATHKKISKITGAGSQVVKHYLDSTHGRHLESREGDHGYIKKDFAEFSKKYKPEHFAESLMDRGPDDTDLEDLEEAELSEGKMEKLSFEELKKRHAEHHENGGGSERSYQAMGAIENHVAKKYGSVHWLMLKHHTDGHALGGGAGMAALRRAAAKVGIKEEELLEYEKYTDDKGVTWNDEGDSDKGHTNWGKGPLKRKPAAQKHYHHVAYKDRDHAKGEGMKWDKEKTKWYHTDAGKSATSKFKKLHEEEEQLDEKAVPMTAEGKKATHTIHVNDDGHKIKAHIVAKDNKHAAQIARMHFPDNAFRVHAIKGDK